MKKRLLSLVLCLVMVFSLFPFAAAADDTDPTEGIHLNKTYDPDTQMLTLESYVEGGVTVTQKAQPCDIVLVLDMSGSMVNEGWFDDNNPWIKVGNISNNDMSQLDTNYGATAGIYRVNQSVFGERSMRYHNGHWQYDSFGIGENWKNIEDVWLSNFFSLNDIEIKKIDALKIAADNFIDEVQKNAEENGVDHQISIVTFATGANTVRTLTPDTTPTEATYLKNTVNGLTATGATRADLGMENAKSILSGVTDPNRGKVVVLFTDGEPTSGNSFEDWVANGAVGHANDLKENGTVVYTVGVFGDSATNKTHQYMNAVSSNHMYAANYSAGATSPEAAGYYMTASNATGLEAIFQTIAEAIGGASVELTEETIIRDVMSNKFELSGVTASDTSKIEIYTADFDGKDPSTGKDTFKSPVSYTGATVEVTNGNQVDVSGFDFSENWVGYDESTQSNHGKKLIIKIPVEPAAGASGNVDTNDSSSGIYVDDESVKPFPVPTVTVPTVNNIVDFNAKMKLATSANSEKMKVASAVNGTFDVNDANELVYQLTSDEQASGNAVINGQYSDMDVVTAWGIPVGSPTGTKAAWATYNVIPGSSVYYDDQLADVTVTVGDGRGYNADIDGVATDTNSVAATDIDNSQTLYFTFFGKGLDIYCTTNESSKYVTASVFRTDSAAGCNAQTRVENNVTGSASQTTMRNYSETERYNVPTLSFWMDEADTYTVRVKTLANSNYKLDGVRVYNPTKEELLADTNEANALFVGLRRDLINNTSSVDISTTNPFDGTGDEDLTVYTGPLFVDGTPEKSLILTDTHGDPITEATVDEDGTLVDTGEARYQSQFDIYTDNGPKNEIYLAAEQSLLFSFSDEVKSALNAEKSKVKVYLGVSAPDAGTGSVKVCNQDVDVTSYVDSYYDVTDYVKNKDVVTIVNPEGGNLISLTYLKITGIDFSTASEGTGAGNGTNSVGPERIFKAVTMETIRLAAAPAAVEEPTVPTVPSVRDIVHQLVSTFIRGLFDSVSRLFNF